MLLYSLNIPPTPSDINFSSLGCTSEGVLLLLAHFEGAGRAKKQEKSHIYAHPPSQLLCRESVLVQMQIGRGHVTHFLSPVVGRSLSCFSLVYSTGLSHSSSPKSTCNASPFQGRQRREGHARLTGTCLIELDVMHPQNFVFTSNKTTKNIMRGS